MNHFLKRHTSPVIVESLFSSSKQTNAKFCFCKNCLRFNPIFRNNVQKVYSSTYVSELKIYLEKSRICKNNENVMSKTENLNCLNKNKKILISDPLQNLSKSKLNQTKKVKIKGKLVNNNKYNIDCTKSYDPNSLNCNLQIEQFYNNKNVKGNLNVLQLESLQNLNKSFKEGDTRVGYLSSAKITGNACPEDEADESLTQYKINKKNKVNNTKNLEHSASESVKHKIREHGANVKKQSVYLSPDYVILEYLYSSLDICYTNNMMKEAFMLFQFYRKKVFWQRIIKAQFPVLTDAYNSLLFSLSCKGYWHLFQKVVSWMEQDGVKLNTKSFAAYLYCLANIRGKISEDFFKDEISKALNLIFQNNVLLNDIFQEPKLTKESCEKILEVVREIIPSFEIEPVTIEINSDSPLLKNLSSSGSFSSMQSQIGEFDVETLNRMVEMQVKMENDIEISVQAVSTGLEGKMNDNAVNAEESLKNKEEINALVEKWKHSVTKALKVALKSQELVFSKDPAGYNLHLHMTSVPLEKYVDILLKVILNMIEFSGGYSPSSDVFRKSIGKKVFMCYQMKKNNASGLTKKMENLFKSYLAGCSEPSGLGINSRQAWQILVQDSERYNQLDPEVIHWPVQVISNIGKILLDLIIKNVTFPCESKGGLREIPVFYTVLRNRNSSTTEEIKSHHLVANLFEKKGFDILHFSAAESPMLCPPKPWKSTNHGGYLFLPTTFIRKPLGIAGKMLLLQNMPPKQLYAAMDSLNALQAVPWKVNEDVLDVALEVFKNGGSERLEVPFLPKKAPPREKLQSRVEFEDYIAEMNKRKELDKKLANNYSLWCEALYRLSLANHFRKIVFWLPHNFDFRGRVYPIPPLINHMGSDLYRSLLFFAKGKPLGPKGLDWLKIHTVNLTGTHKRSSIEERLEYANLILPDILDSAKRPLTGKKWWMESENPWQTLGACFELKKALSVANPEEYISNFPVHQDGSCNGLQHYAALGKDLVGAKSVNLVPSELPQDVYTVVSNLVEQERRKDASNGVQIANILNGCVSRKIVKQTVMTNVYGVTNFGATLQIKRRLEELPDFPKEYISQASRYLTVKTFYSLRQMFTSAKEIQDWLVHCASEISKNKDYVQWVSPMGLPVLQNYAKFMHKSIRKVVVPHSLKQSNAFPPNFIHTLDSCHMMLTALYCEKAGITFAAVHDCFWTHPADVDIMNRICREQFIALHSLPILENLSEFFVKTYGSKFKSEKCIELFNAVPEKGEFDLKEVLNSVYFFS